MLCPIVSAFLIGIGCQPGTRVASVSTRPRPTLRERNQERTRDEIDLMRLQADTNVQLAAFRLAGLSSDSVTIVNELIKVLREQQGLPKDPPDVIAAGLGETPEDARLRVVGGPHNN